MIKSLISVAVASLLGCGIANAADNASIEGKEKITRNGVNIFLDPNSPNKQKYLNGEFDKSLERMKKAYEANKNNKAVRGPAPPVTQVLVLNVCSTKYGGCEYIDDNQTETRYDHDGSFFMVETAVMGYGGSNTDMATFAGNQATLYDYAGIDMNGDNIIDGWQELWDISKPANTSGYFEYTARSMNAPGNSMSTGIQIK
ncbi:DUF4879 domain-containing protein [Helicobacter sp. MIT 11-5569]|uniref:DUF4879 domain-containing protein n=1 Tax=Helicobacter sp. MIT 11-5569 TaxID=1548151 RepID=UPI00068DF87D|nr:DUF4879 domain-containing protein [Helicobacter sp. MIT 11-5569]TLD81387.1 DUF4879 domain-containing protein [Helicobacter sp. MIT 11-5569]